MSNFLRTVPTLDISKFNSGEDNLVEEFSNSLGTSFNQTGFAIIKTLILLSIKNFFQYIS